jgi:hypothetical protein
MSVRCLPSPVRAKPRGAIVGADCDADSHVEGEWSVGEDLEHPPAAEVLRLLGAGDVAGDGLHGTLRQARHGAGAGRDQRRSGEVRHLGERAARDGQDPRPVIATRWPERSARCSLIGERLAAAISSGLRRARRSTQRYRSVSGPAWLSKQSRPVPTAAGVPGGDVIV